MEERHHMRMAGKWNKPLRPHPHKTGLPTTLGHPWQCECEMCRPWLWSDGKKTDTDRDELKDKYAKPHTIIPPSTLQSQPKGKGFPVPTKRWTSRGNSGN